MNIFQKIISKLYHKYVSRPNAKNKIPLEEYLLYCEEFYEICDNYILDTYEQIEFVQQVAYKKFKMKQLAQGLLDEGFDKPVIIGDKEYVESFNNGFDELKNNNLKEIK